MSISKDGCLWGIKVEGNSTPIHFERTQADAQAWAGNRAKILCRILPNFLGSSHPKGIEVTTHKLDGRFGTKSTYGHDPKKTRG